MKLGGAGSVLMFACFLVEPSSDAPAGERACSVRDCFYAREVRDFKVVDRDTVIVYVGAQKCAFRVELRGTYDRPIVTGRADVEEGVLTFEGRRYVLTRGAIDFNNPTRIDPFFDIETETRVRVPSQTYRVMVRATGTKPGT